MRALKTHNRYPYTPITRRPDYCWPEGKRLALYLGFNIEHFEFGTGLGAKLAPSGDPDVMNYSWRDYGNRVGAWRCLDLFEEFKLPAGVLINTALYDYCPELIAAFRARGDEIIGHGHTNAERQGDMTLEAERALIQYCTGRITREEGKAPRGWLSPWISESDATPDLLAEAGYRYTLNWCHDDQPHPFAVNANGAPGTLWSIPYPQELNDIPAIMARQNSAEEFADMIIDCYDEMLAQSTKQPIVMGIALHPYIIGQPHRLRQLRRAFAHIAASGRGWWTTPSGILDHVTRTAC
jgi:allantoinase